MGALNDLQDNSSLQPFFEIDPPSGDAMSWQVRPEVFARNHMGTVHGGALCLLAVDIAGRAFRRASGKSLDGYSLAISFLRPVDDSATVDVTIDRRGDVGCVSLLVRSAGRVCNQATAVGRYGAAAETRISAAPRVAWDLPTPLEGGVPFRDTIGVTVAANEPRSLVARWVPSQEFRRFGSTNGRVLAIAAALVDTGGSLVNAGPEGRLVTRYVTASITASLFDRALDSVLGPARIEEVGDGRRIRSTVATFTDPHGSVTGRGSAQFAALATPLALPHPQVPKQGAREPGK
jgi:acyl-coenzyme A thioesterase PaaI-like protein